jgi:hypothetical protein
MDIVRDIVSGLMWLIAIAVAMPVLPLGVWYLWEWRRQKARRDAARAVFSEHLAKIGYSTDAIEYIVPRMSWSHKWLQFENAKDPAKEFGRYELDLLRHVENVIPLPAEWRTSQQNRQERRRR